MRIVDNCTFEADAALAIATEMYEMEEGAGMSKRQTMEALQNLGGGQTHRSHASTETARFFETSFGNNRDFAILVRLSAYD
eukprot:COSAG05_NODE_103_length_19033_cov_99.004278_18_plen_81_part_00